MGLISRLVNFVTGTTISSSEVNGEYDQILGVLNGNIDTDNIGTVAISAIANLGSEHNDSGTHKDISTTGITSTGVVSVTRATVFDNTFASKVAADSFSRFAVVAGAVSLGGGAAAPDVRFLRLAAKSIRFDDGAGGSINDANFLCTSDKITHNATTRNLVRGASSAKVGDDSDPANLTDAVITPKAADSVYDAFYMPVTLPAGATVTKLTITGATVANPANEVVVGLNRAGVTSESVGLMAATSFSNGGTTDSETSITNPVILDTYRYFLSGLIKAFSSTTDAKFYAATIEYTTVNLSQV